MEEYTELCRAGNGADEGSDGEPGEDKGENPRSIIYIFFCFCQVMYAYLYLKDLRADSNEFCVRGRKHRGRVCRGEANWPGDLWMSAFGTCGVEGSHLFATRTMEYPVGMPQTALPWGPLYASHHSPLATAFLCTTADSARLIFFFVTSEIAPLVAAHSIEFKLPLLCS